MHTPPTPNLQGLERVLNYKTGYCNAETVWISTVELAKLLRLRFYFLQVKLTDARGGRGIAARQELSELECFVKGAKLWVASQEKEMTNFERREFEVMLISGIGSRLLKTFLSFDRVMCDLAGAQYFGGQSENLRVNYLHGFTRHIQNLLAISTKGPFHFYPDGTPRELAET